MTNPGPKTVPPLGASCVAPDAHVQPATQDANTEAHHSLHHGFKYPDMTIYLSHQVVNDIVSLLECKEKTHRIICANVHVHTYRINFGAAANRVLTLPNAGGPSVLSEALSAELLDRILGIRSILTEMEVKYHPRTGPITDFACTLRCGIAVGVSVTRAIAHHHLFSKEDALRLLTKKLKGIIRSTARIVNMDIDRQILHIWTSTSVDASTIERACASIPPSLLRNTLILITPVNMTTIFY